MADLCSQLYVHIFWCSTNQATVQLVSSLSGSTEVHFGILSCAQNVCVFSGRWLQQFSTTEEIN
uniref:Uncharacterized protein n=1 Tax=Anguilla anguilla TaxID=7936 RepID=A0A0E9P9X7_ANGAN